MSHLESGTIHALLDGEIPSSELGPIQGHLATCAECRTLLETERGLLAESDGLIELIELPGDTPITSGVPRRRWVRGLAWAASLAAAVGLGWVGRGWQRPEARIQSDQVVAPVPAPAVVPLAAPAPAPAPSPARSSENAPGRPRADNLARAKTAPRRAPAPVVAQRELKAEVDSRDAITPAPQPRVDSGALRREAQVAAAAPAPAAGAAASSVSAPLEVMGRKVSGFRLGELVKSAAPPEAIGLPDAVRRLGGSLRLIEGMVPLRLEAQGQTVRVVYATAQGELVLSQRLVDGRVEVSLLAPPGFSPDSLARLRSKVRE
jgi:hypothetical protein